MDITQAAQTLGLAESTLRWQIKNRKLRAHKMGGRWYISEAECRRYELEHKRKGATNGTP